VYDSDARWIAAGKKCDKDQTSVGVVGGGLWVIFARFRKLIMSDSMTISYQII
jgi:hypothetical protein